MYGDLFTSTTWKSFVHLMKRDERVGVGKYLEVMEDPRDAVVRKHGWMANAMQEEWMWIMVVGQRHVGLPIESGEYYQS